MKLLLEKNYIKFLISEILMLVVNIFTYRLCCIRFSDGLSSIVALIVSLFFDYILCYKYVFKDDLNDDKYRGIKFAFWGLCSFLIKHLTIKVFYYNLSMHLFLSKILGLIVVILFNYFTKCSVFQKGYKIKIDKIRKVYDVVNEWWEKFISLKYIGFFFKFLPQNLFVFLFFVISIYYTFTFIRDYDDMNLYNQVVSDSHVDIINETFEVNFSDITVEEDVDTVCLVFGTRGKTNNSSLLFELYDNNDSLVYDYKINTNTLNDGQGFCLSVPLIKKEELKDYSLKVISKDADEDNYVALFINEETGEPTLYLKRSHEITSFKYILMVIIFVLFLGLNYYINRKGEKISEHKFLLIMLCYFLAVLILNPPLENPDEPSHLYSSYNLSQNWLDANEETDIVVPDDIECLNYANIQNTDRVVEFKKVDACLKEADNKKTDLMFGVSNRVTNSFLGHLPQAISIRLVDIFSNSSLFIFYFARLGNFLVAFVILYWAIKIAPVGKKILLFIGLTPMFVQQITSLSYDALLNSLALLFIAYIIRCFYKTDKIKARDIIIPVIFLLVMLTVKTVYVPLGILLFFIPKDRFQAGKQKLVYLFSIIGLVLIGKYLIQDVFFVNLLPSDGNMERQIAYILNNPLKLFPIAIKTLKVNGWFYLKSMVGYFCWFRFSLSDVTVIAWIVCFVLLILSTKNVLNFSVKEEKFKKISYQKVLYTIAILISIAGVFASMYFAWSEYALDYVDGVQGRYFIPILGFVAMLFMPKKERIRFSKDTLYSFCNVLLFQYLIYLITYFY